MNPTRPLLPIALMLTLAVALLALGGCASDVGEPTGDDPPYVGHEEASDFDPVASSKADGVMQVFMQNNVLSDSFFRDEAFLTAEGMQDFFEMGPYNQRCWLADEMVDGSPFSEIIVEAAVEHHINPLLLLARMQVEAGLVSKMARPSQFKIDRAAGCGCFDGEACQRAYLGLEAQMHCAAETLSNRYDDSLSGLGAWRVEHTNKTLDSVFVRPENNATAALYAYTPWVLTGQGGTWLVWNITRRYERFAQENGMAAHLGVGDPFIGVPCTENTQCDFQSGDDQGFCLVLQEGAGFCSMPCEGYCPDKSGHAGTFCAALAPLSSGVCTAKAESFNDDCGSIPGTAPTWVSRFIGASSASDSSAEVCVP